MRGLDTAVTDRLTAEWHTAAELVSDWRTLHSRSLSWTRGHWAGLGCWDDSLSPTSLPLQHSACAWV